MAVGPAKQRGSSSILTISVVLATYNGAQFLAEQLASIGAQTHQPAEIIVGDDQSSDDTMAIVEAFAASSSCPVRIVRNPNRLGYRENFLHAATLATGDVIAFSDQDDIWHPEKLERCLVMLDDPSVVLVVHRVELIDQQGDRIGHFSQGITSTGIQPPLAYDPWITFWGFSMMFRRSLLSLADRTTRFIDFVSPENLIAHDRWVMFLAQIVGCTAEVAEPLALYRQHGNNLFGAAKQAGGESLRDRSEAYATATRRMAEIVKALPSGTEDMFPAFDRAAAIAFIEAARDQADFRLGLHHARAGLPAFAGIASGMMHGRYRQLGTGGIRWRSLGRDLSFAATGR